MVVLPIEAVMARHVNQLSSKIYECETRMIKLSSPVLTVISNNNMKSKQISLMLFTVFAYLPAQNASYLKKIRFEFKVEGTSFVLEQNMTNQA